MVAVTATSLSLFRKNAENPMIAMAKEALDSVFRITEVWFDRKDRGLWSMTRRVCHKPPFFSIRVPCAEHRRFSPRRSHVVSPEDDGEEVMVSTPTFGEHRDVRDHPRIFFLLSSCRSCVVSREKEVASLDVPRDYYVPWSVVDPSSPVLHLFFFPSFY